MIIEIASNIYKSEGIRGFYKGNVLSVAGVTPFIAIRQSTYDFQVNNLSHKFFNKEEIK